MNKFDKFMLSNAYAWVMVSAVLVISIVLIIAQSIPTPKSIADAYILQHAELYPDVVCRVSSIDYTSSEKYSAYITIEEYYDDLGWKIGDFLFVKKELGKWTLVQ